MKYIKGSKHSINGSIGSVRNGPGVYPMKQAGGSQTSVASASSHNLERFSPHSCGTPRKSIWFTKSEAPYFVFLTNSQVMSVLLIQGPHFENHWTRLVFSLPCSFFSILADRVRLSVQTVNVFVLSSVQFSCSVMSDSLRPHESQHARPPCPSPTPGVHPGSRPPSQWDGWMASYVGTSAFLS